LEVTLNFFRKTTTSTTTPAPQVIVISNSKEEVEIIPKPIVEEQLEQVFASRPMEEELQQPVVEDK
jgi:hypothetical protein